MIETTKRKYLEMSRRGSGVDFKRDELLREIARGGQFNYRPKLAAGASSSAVVMILVPTCLKIVLKKPRDTGPWEAGSKKQKNKFHQQG